MKHYHVYIVRCSDGSYYSGITNDVERRIWQHNEGIDPGCYTYKRRPVELVYVATFWDVWQAIAWEKQIKRWSRKKKEALIQSDFVRLCMHAWSGYRRRINAMVRRAHHDISNVILSPSKDEPVEG